MMNDEFGFLDGLGDNLLGSADKLDALFRRLDQGQDQKKQSSNTSSTEHLPLSVQQTFQQQNNNGKAQAPGSDGGSTQVSNGPIPFQLHHSKQHKQKIGKEKEQRKDDGERPKKKRHYKKRTKKNQNKQTLDLEKLTTDDILSYTPGLLFDDKHDTSIGNVASMQSHVPDPIIHEGNIQSFIQGLDLGAAGIGDLSFLNSGGLSSADEEPKQKRGPGRPRKKRKYTKHKKDPNAPKKPKKPRKPRKPRKKKTGESGAFNGMMDSTGLVSLKTEESGSDIQLSRSASVLEENPATTKAANRIHINLPESMDQGINFKSDIPIHGTPLSEMPKHKEHKKKIKQPEPEKPQPLGENGVPLDMIEGMKYLQTKFEAYKEVNIAEKLLSKKRDEDEGIERDDDDSEEPEFGDLLDLFDINPEEISLDLTLNEKRRLLLESMDNEQMSRYEFFRRTNLNTGSIRRLVSSTIGQSISTSLAKIIGGVGKMFVGDMVERAKDAQRKQFESQVIEQLNYKRALKKHENAIQRLKAEGKTEFSAIEKPGPPPTFYKKLRDQSKFPTRDPYTYNNFRVIIPDSNLHLTADHVREAYRLYRQETPYDINGRWSQQGGGNGLLFR